VAVGRAQVWQDVTPESLRIQADLYASLPLGPEEPWQHWLAFTGPQPHKGEPVGMASGLFTEQAVLVEHLGVIPAYRGGGIGAALVCRVVAAARQRGVRYAVLGPTRESRTLYERLGFTVQQCLPDRQFYLP
jgi:GNAT superfamily N-acetyltransferase